MIEVGTALPLTTPFTWQGGPPGSEQGTPGWPVRWTSAIACGTLRLVPEPPVPLMVPVAVAPARKVTVTTAPWMPSPVVVPLQFVVAAPGLIVTRAQANVSVPVV